MRQLRTFGGLSIQDDGASLTGAATQRKTLALLALLSASDNHGMSRDKLIACLWPESDTEHGRNLLKQACFGLRRDLHQPELFLGTTELRLNPAAISSDVHAFQEAVERGDLAGAVGLYRGPFLDGFYLNDADDFERWVETERARIARVVCEALEQLATHAAARGDHRAAEQCWRRLTQIDPLSSRAALGLMMALVAAGEPAGAIQHARAHEAHVEQELGAPPDAAILALVKQLCEEAEGGSSPLAPASAPRRHQSTTDFLLAALPVALRRELHRATALSTAAAAVAIVVVIGAVAYGGSGRRSATRGTEPVAVAGRKMLVVLPFENRGEPKDEYFADGLTEAIATRLGSVRRLGVIAWQSASQYKGSSKSPQEIGRELGVEYILQGSVRWERESVASRVRVSPALIRVSDAAQLWADQYDTTLTGVFSVQTDLATRVAGALDIALVDAERRMLEARPTANLQAYDLYLRGRELVDREFSLENVRTATHLYERAVALDSNFALAYAWLSVNYVWMHDTHMERSPEQLTRARAALDRALRLDPDLPESHGALGFYYFHVVGDNNRALEEYTRLRRSRPNDPYFPAVMADIYTQQGRWNEALAYYHEAVLLDPRNVILTIVMGIHYTALRQFPAAGYYYDRALALKPQSVDAQLGRALAYLSQTGDLAGSQRLLPDLAQGLAPSSFGTQILSLCDVATLLDAGQQARLLELTPAALDDRDSASLALAKGMVLRARGRISEARVHFDSARIALELKVLQEPADELRRALLGRALAGLGRAAEAVREGERAVHLVPVSKDAEVGALLIANLARIYVLLDDREKAIDQLQLVLSRPGPLSAAWLRADPFWDPLRASPTFQRLAASN